MMKIVFNSSPLIFLSRLEFLDLFLSTEFQFLLPASVKKEISAKQDQSSQHINILISENKLLVQKVQLISLPFNVGSYESYSASANLSVRYDYFIQA